MTNPLITDQHRGAAREIHNKRAERNKFSHHVGCEAAIQREAELLARWFPVREEPRWIPVSEQPVPQNDNFLARIEYNFQGHLISERIVCHLGDNDELLTEAGDDVGWTDKVIVEWQPLPSSLLPSGEEPAK